jgi:hypothetical protein
VSPEVSQAFGICLVLKSGEFEPDSLILYRNSYDLDREPIRGAIKNGTTSLEVQAEALAGDRSVAPDMFVCKILGDEVRSDLAVRYQRPIAVPPPLPLYLNNTWNHIFGGHVRSARSN